VAIEKDDLSLLAGMSEKEHKKFRAKGIFTVTQLSYTFRPRRRPRRLRGKQEKYHHSLKALAIREKKIHIVGNPEMKIEGTPVYLDVEGMPDRDFYYLIGMRIGNAESAVQHSLWADTVEGEGEIWQEFRGILETVENPVLIHYGRFETIFLKRMSDRYGGQAEGSVTAKSLETTVNVLSVLFAQIYLPTYSNGLKDVAKNLGFQWSDPMASGARSVVVRRAWEQCRDSTDKEWLVRYNVEDCEALEVVTASLLRICGAAGPPKADILHATLAGFKGVLVSDFYAAYDSLECPQQKCLIHLLRDLNDDVLSHPYDEEVKSLVKHFGSLVRPMVETVDRYGLKRHFLRKYRKIVDRFFKDLGKASYQSEIALKAKERFEKNRHKLFTFLDYDGIPWNNNNAEHAIKAFAALRDVMQGTSTRAGVEEYLTLLSVCQTCKYMGVDFLDFLRSGEKDIHTFAENRPGRKRRLQCG